MCEVSRPILRWHGGKWRIAPWILDQFPDHDAYVEPFGGGGSVLLRKARSRLEIYNDLDGKVVNLFQVLRDRPEELAYLVSATPFSRRDFDLAHEDKGDPLLRAADLLIRSHMGFGSNAHERRSGFRAAGLREGSLPVHRWANLPGIVRDTAERFRGVVIENRLANQVMADNDGTGVLHYVDPPYVASTRGTGTDYAHEMTDDDHGNLLDLLKTLSGRVVLSGYPCELYDNALTGWRRIKRETYADAARLRTEVLWMNFEPSRDDLFSAITTKEATNG